MGDGMVKVQRVETQATNLNVAGAAVRGHPLSPPLGGRERTTRSESREKRMDGVYPPSTGGRALCPVPIRATTNRACENR